MELSNKSVSLSKPKTKNMIKLIHFSKYNTGEPKETEHKFIMDVVKTLMNRSYENNTVYLLSFYDKETKKHLTFVSEYWDFILDTLENTHYSFDASYAETIHLHEYHSYETAYKVALDITEEHSRLTYEPES